MRPNIFVHPGYPSNRIFPTTERPKQYHSDASMPSVYYNDTSPFPSEQIAIQSRFPIPDSPNTRFLINIKPPLPFSVDLFPPLPVWQSPRPFRHSTVSWSGLLTLSLISVHTAPKSSPAVVRAVSGFLGISSIGEKLNIIVR